ncbi:MAG: hypothetical protein ABJA75_07815, partial [Bradyrhizobium sp.]
GRSDESHGSAPKSGLLSLDWCARESRQSGASLAKRTTRRSFHRFFVATENVFRRDENCFVVPRVNDCLTRRATNKKAAL